MPRGECRLCHPICRGLIFASSRGKGIRTQGFESAGVNPKPERNMYLSGCAGAISQNIGTKAA